jgi:leucyl aminopeptidase (aminopeptidase T)
VPGSAEGRIVVDQLFFQGREVHDLELTIANGRLVSMTASSGIEPLQALYDASDDEKDELSTLDIGLNPDVQIPDGSSLRTWVPAGMVTLGIGNNLWASGANSSGFFLPVYLPASTLEVDGTVLVRGGQLVR